MTCKIPAAAVLLLLALIQVCHGASLSCPTGQYRQDDKCKRCIDCSLLYRATLYKCTPFGNGKCGACLPGNVDLFHSQTMMCTPCAMQPNHHDCIITSTTANPMLSTTLPPEETGTIDFWMVGAVGLVMALIGIGVAFYRVRIRKCCQSNPSPGSSESGSRNSLKDAAKDEKDKLLKGGDALQGGKENGTVEKKEQPNTIGISPVSPRVVSTSADEGTLQKESPQYREETLEKKREESLQSAQPIQPDMLPPQIDGNLQGGESTSSTIPPTNPAEIRRRDCTSTPVESSPNATPVNGSPDVCRGTPFQNHITINNIVSPCAFPRQNASDPQPEPRDTDERFHTSVEEEGKPGVQETSKL